jgi:toxin YoeB
VSGYSLRLSDKTKEDIIKHKKFGNKLVVEKITNLLEEVCKTPFSGTGKPESLKHKLSGRWSRRINREHRLVYKVEGNVVLILSAFGHYE